MGSGHLERLNLGSSQHSQSQSCPQLGSACLALQWAKPGEFSSHPSSLSFGMCCAPRKCQGPQDTLPGALWHLWAHLASPAHFTPYLGWGGPHTPIAL